MKFSPKPAASFVRLLGADFAKVMELQADGETLLVRAGVGWEPGVVGNTTVKAEEGTSEHYAFDAGEPVVSGNLDHEVRFIYPDFLREHGVMAFVNVPIVGRAGEGSYGMLQVDTRMPRDFSERDINFLRTYANLLAATVARAQTIQQLAAQVRELHHRVRNVLATVQGMMGATARSVESVEDFKHAFSGRLAAIARAHTLLRMDNWETASLEALLRDEIQSLNPVDGRRISLVGPDVDLPANLAIPLSMGIHELADNAIRHGALSTIVGRVKVDWSVRDDDKTTLVLNWLETNGPPVEPPARTGYGTVLLTKVLPAQADARCTLTFDPSGLAFHLEAPLAHAR